MVDAITFADGHPRLRAGDQEAEYDLLVGAVGVNSLALKLFERVGTRYQAPAVSKTYICEFCFGRDMIRRELGYSMHVFLLNLPRLEFAAQTPGERAPAVRARSVLTPGPGWQQPGAVARLPGVAAVLTRAVAVMPDVHLGKGATVGSVIANRGIKLYAESRGHPGSPGPKPARVKESESRAETT